MSDTKRSCFIIMPFSTTTPEHTEEYWTRHFHDFLKPLIEEIPILEARRSEELRGDILRQIINELISCDIVVADLTDKNPNVYWELGVRQSFRHSTITIAEFGTHIPFDLSTKGILWYFPNDHVKNEQFRNQLKTALRDCNALPNRPDSSVLESLSGRGTMFERFRIDEAERRLDALSNELGANLKFLKHCIEDAKENKKNEKNNISTKTMTRGHMRTIALELLITDRYLDEQESFYSSGESLYGELVFLDDEIKDWLTNYESVNAHLDAWGQKTYDKTMSFRSSVLKAKEKLAANLK